MVINVKITSKHVYFQTYSSIIQYSPVNETIKIFNAENNQRFNVGFVYKDIYHTRESLTGLIKIENNVLKKVPNSEFFTKNIYKNALPYDDKLLISTPSNGLYLYKPNVDSIPLKFILSNEDFIKKSTIYKMELFQNDKYLIGTLNNGAILLNKKGKILQAYNDSVQMQGNTIYDIFTDNYHNIWYCLSNGISKTEHAQDYSYWGKNEGIKDQVTGIIRHKGILYFSTFTKVYYIDKKNKIKEVQNIPIGQNWCFLETKNKKSLLVGTSFGIFEIKENLAVQVYKGSLVLTMYQSEKDSSRIFATDFNHLISLKYENGIWVKEAVWKGIEDYIRGIIEDKNGLIWLSTDRNGVIKVNPDYKNFSVIENIKYYNKNAGFKLLKNIFPFKYKNKIIWLSENGLYEFNSEKDNFMPFCELGEKYCNGTSGIYSLTEMPDGKIWIFSANNEDIEISWLYPKSNNNSLVYKPFKRISLQDKSAFYVDSSGVLWVGGLSSLHKFDQKKDIKNYNQKFNCLIRLVTIGNDSVIYGGNIPDLINEYNKAEIDYKLNNIKFEYAAPFFDQEENTLYSIMLEGFDKEWSKWNKIKEKEFTNLKEGKYVFKVKAKNIYGQESDITEYEIIIQPPFYRTFVAYGFYILFFLFFIYFNIKMFNIRLLKQKKHLDILVKERTLKINNQKEEITIQAELLRNQNEELLKMNEFKQVMTSMIVHDLKNPLNLILNLPKTKNPENQLEIVKQSGKQMLNMVLNILDVNKYKETSMKIELHEKQLIVIVIEAIKQVKFLYEQKEIVIDNKVDDQIFVKTDEEISERIVVNLLTNAIKYSPVNSTITISSTLLCSSFIRIEIKDDGDGIPEDKIHLVFKKFEQIVAKKSGGISSTWLGLAFCKLAVEAHGGEIGVKSESKIGTTFWFTLQAGKGKSENIKIFDNQESNNILFSDTEKELLIPVINKLKEYTIYETSDIEEIIAELYQLESKNIKMWICKMERNIATLNQLNYLELININ